jgi:excisionase family DNA binding protein
LGIVEGNASRLLSLQEAADYLNISKAHLSNVINGKVRDVRPVRSVRMGRCVRMKREWLDEWLEQAAREAPSKC